jgi:hypothetical protein
MVVDALLGVFGPFLIPALIFAVGVVGYLVLVALTRYGILPGRARNRSGDRGNN